MLMERSAPSAAGRTCAVACASTDFLAMDGTVK
jgi:hypothetical protein